MSQENVAIVQRFHEAYRDGQLDTLAETILDAEIEWQASDVFGVLHGRSAVVAHLNDFAASFEGKELAPPDLVDAGDQVVGTFQASGVGRSSGVSVDIRFAIVYSLRENRVVRVREFETRSEALKAVGLED